MGAVGDGAAPGRASAREAAEGAGGSGEGNGRPSGWLPAIGARVEALPYLARWLVLGVVIGAAAGAGAIVFYEALRLGSYVFLDLIGGYRVPTPAGEGNLPGSSGFSRPWAIPLSVGLGGLLAGLAVFGFAPEAEGHGTDSAIDAVHHHPTGIRGRTSAVKIIASAFTIGSGGSGGREGPTGQISAGFASVLARRAGLSERTARLGVAAGIGSGIGAIFSAPLGGTLLGPEILYKYDFEAEALVPSLIASVVAFTIFGLDVGYGPLFGSHDSLRFHTGDIPYYVLIGLLGGLIGRAYSGGFYGLAHLLHRLPVPRPLTTTLAGLAVGAGALAVPQILGTGYGNLQKAMGAGLLALPLWLVVVVPLARIAATGLSIGSGGSGGIFGPGMVIGGFTGAAVWRVAHDAGLLVPHSPAPFVIVGMAACFGGISHAPMGVLVMVTEMTGSLDLLLASLMGLAVSIVVVGGQNIYKAQPGTRGQSPARRMARGRPERAVAVGEVASPPRLVLEGAADAAEALARLEEAGLPGAPVVDGARAYLGAVRRRELSEAVRTAAGSRLALSDVLDRDAPSLAADLSLGSAIDSVATAPGRWRPVVDAEGRLVGIMSPRELAKGFGIALDRGEVVARGGRILIEGEAEEGSGLAGRPLRDLALPEGTLVVALRRDGEALEPTAETVLRPGDILGLVTRYEDVVAIRQALAGDPDRARVDDGRGLGPGGLI